MGSRASFQVTKRTVLPQELRQRGELQGRMGWSSGQGIIWGNVGSTVPQCKLEA